MLSGRCCGHGRPDKRDNPGLSDEFRLAAVTPVNVAAGGAELAPRTIATAVMRATGAPPRLAESDRSSSICRCF
jgi:hypothetical protein